MFIPIGTDRRLKHRPVVNVSLIAINVVIFLAEELTRTRPDLVIAWTQLGVLMPAGGREWYQFITYQFLHGDWMHLIFNMLFLYVFGNAMEDRFGSWGYLFFYLAGGVIAGMAHTFTSPAPVVGASGSIAAVTGAFLALFPLTQVRVLVLFFIITIFEISSMWLILFFFMRDVLFQFIGGTNVAYLAHIGGALFGFAVGMALLAARLLPREAFDFLALANRWNRRRQFREVTRQGARPWMHQAGSSGTPGSRLTTKKLTEEEQRIMDMRAAVGEAFRAGDLDRALDTYERLLAIDENQLLGRNMQMDLANYAMRHERYGTAARAYRLLLKEDSSDPEQVEVRLMLGLIHTRYLPDSEKARPHLEQAAKTASDPSRKQLAKTLLDELTDH